MLCDGKYTSFGLVSEGRATSYGTPAIADQDWAPHSKRAKPGQSDPPDIGHIVTPGGLCSQRLGEINVLNTISKRSNSTVTGIGIIAGGILLACLAVLLLGLLPCYLKRRRARLQGPDVVNAEKGAVTQVCHESDNVTPFTKTLSIVKEESIRSATSFSHASSETAVPTIETEERRGPPPFNRPVGSASPPSSPPSPFHRFGDRTGGAVVLTLPPRPLLRPDNSADNDRGLGQFGGSAFGAVRSKSVRFAGRYDRPTPTSGHSTLPNPWDSAGSPPPLPGSTFERVLFRLPDVPESAAVAAPARRAHSLRVAGLPRSPRDFPVSRRVETRSPSIPETASEHRKSFGDARRPIRPI